MEYCRSCECYSTEGMALPFGRGSFYKNPYDKAWENIKPSVVCCGLHLKGENREKARVRKTGSNWEDRGKLFNPSLNRCKNGRQTINCSHGGQPCTNLWTRMSTRNRDRQGLLLSRQHHHIWDQHGWFTKTGIREDQATRRSGPTSQGPPSRYRALDWSFEILRFKKIKNEVRQGNSCLSVHLYHGLQYSPNIETSRWEIQSCLKKYRTKINEYSNKNTLKIRLSENGFSIDSCSFATATN